jgi:hypothetical protein
MNITNVPPNSEIFEKFWERSQERCQFWFFAPKQNGIRKAKKFSWKQIPEALPVIFAISNPEDTKLSNSHSSCSHRRDVFIYFIVNFKHFAH